MAHTHETACTGCEKCSMHEHEHKESKAPVIIRISVSAVLLVCAILLEHLTKLPGIVSAAVYVIAFLVVGYEVVFTVIKNLIHFDIHDIFDEEFLMLLASIGAFALSESAEAVVIMLFWQIGEFFQDYAVDKSRDSIEQLMDIRPDSAALLLSNGTTQETEPCEVEKGSLIVVKAGEKVPLDGIIESGECNVDTSSLTGESMPRNVRCGDEVLSGFINKDGLITVRTTGTYEESAVARILALIETEDKAKSRSEKFINRFARVYTPIVVGAAVMLAVLPPLITGTMAFSEWIHRALLFLVVSCPCALVISVPLAFYAGIGKASAHGILIKGSSVMDTVSKINTVAFDKTGTITTGTFAVTEIIPEDGVEKKELLRIAKSAEINSNHPIAVAVTKACTEDAYPVVSYGECAGRGVKARIKTPEGEADTLVGNAAFLSENGIEATDHEGYLFAAYNGRLLGRIKVEDSIKDGTSDAITSLRQQGCSMWMLTGDTDKAAKPVAEKLGIEYHAGLLPQDKAEFVKNLMRSDVTAFAGDGINDTPVLTAADVGFAMGGLGQDAAIEAADAVIMDDDLRKIALAKQIARKTLRIAKGNIVFALIIKAAILGIGAFGFGNMYLAVFADVGVSLLCVFNSLRAQK